MTVPIERLSLVVPGLLDPAVLDPAVANDLLAELLPLRTLLARADTRLLSDSGLEATVFSLFGMEPPTGRDFPVAPMTRLADTGQADAAVYLRADPVHLRPDQDRLLLFNGEGLGITPEEAQALIGVLSEHFADRDLHFEAPVPDRWYVRLPREPQIETVCPSELVGRDIRSHMPHGPDAMQWHGALNEVQMLLHQHQVNRVREESGRPTINSVWFWGGGTLPGVPPMDWEVVWSTEPLSGGLARAAGIERRDLPPDAGGFRRGQGGRQLVVYDAMRGQRPGDVERWTREARRLNEHWIAPLLASVGAGRVHTLELFPCNGTVYRMTRRSLLRFWRRKPQLFLS